MAKQNENSKSGIIFGLIFAAIIVWGSYQLSTLYYFQPEQDELLKEQVRLVELKRSNDENEQIKTNAEQLEKSLTEAERGYAALKPLVPPEAELPKILDWLASKAYERALKLEHFSQGSQIKQQGSMSEIPIQVEVLGYYDSVSRYVEDFSRFQRVLRVHAIHMQQETSEHSQFATVRATISFSAYVSKEKNDKADANRSANPATSTVK